MLKRLFTACEKYGVLTIADEVATGFGRTGALFACEQTGLTPDIMCVAKGLTGGYLPLAATIAKEEIYSAFCGDYASGRELAHGHTFTGNPLAAAAACETLAIIKEEGIPQSLAGKAEFFRTRLQTLQELDEAGDIRSIGMIGAVELVENRETKRPFGAQKRIGFRIAQKALEKGLLLRPLGNVVYFVPAYIISEEEIATMIDTARDVIKDVLHE